MRGIPTTAVRCSPAVAGCLLARAGVTVGVGRHVHPGGCREVVSSVMMPCVRFRRRHQQHCDANCWYDHFQIRLHVQSHICSSHSADRQLIRRVLLRTRSPVITTLCAQIIHLQHFYVGHSRQRAISWIKGKFARNSEKLGKHGNLFMCFRDITSSTSRMNACSSIRDGMHARLNHRP